LIHKGALKSKWNNNPSLFGRDMKGVIHTSYWSRGWIEQTPILNDIILKIERNEIFIFVCLFIFAMHTVKKKKKKKKERSD
jgi:hypothetical protein